MANSGEVPTTASAPGWSRRRLEADVRPVAVEVLRLAGERHQRLEELLVVAQPGGEVAVLDALLLGEQRPRAGSG